MSRLSRALLLLLLAAPAGRADDWPQWLGPQRDGVWRERGILQKIPAQGLKVLWRAPVGGGYSGPAVAGGRVFVPDRVADPGDGSMGVERLLCLDQRTGKLLWTHSCPCTYTASHKAGPRATPAVDGNRVYTFGTQGDLYCLDVRTGKPIWSRPGGQGVPMWGCAACPLVDGNKLICLTGGKDTLVTAFDKMTGRVLWTALDAKDPGYCSPVIFEAGGRRQLIVWHPEALVSLDPETGETLWSERHHVEAGMTVATPRKLGDLLFVSSFFDGALMMKLDAGRPAATRLWRRGGKSVTNTDALHDTISPPLLRHGYIYGVCAYGQLRCLKADTGDRVWETLAPTTRDGRPTRWATAFLVPSGDRVFLANELGDLILADLSPAGYKEIGRAHVLEPTNRDDGRPVVWSHPAFANRCLYWRNDREVVCVSLAE